MEMSESKISISYVISKESYTHMGYTILFEP